MGESLTFKDAASQNSELFVTQEMGVELGYVVIVFSLSFDSTTIVTDHVK